MLLHGGILGLGLQKRILISAGLPVGYNKPVWSTQCNIPAPLHWMIKASNIKIKKTLNSSNHAEERNIKLWFYYNKQRRK